MGIHYFFFDSVDASRESGRYGRLVNHSRKRPNCQVQVINNFLFHIFQIIGDSSPAQGGDGEGGASHLPGGGRGH